MALPCRNPEIRKEKQGCPGGHPCRRREIWQGPRSVVRGLGEAGEGAGRSRQDRASARRSGWGRFNSPVHESFGVSSRPSTGSLSVPLDPARSAQASKTGTANARQRRLSGFIIRATIVLLLRVVPGLDRLTTTHRGFRSRRHRCRACRHRLLPSCRWRRARRDRRLRSSVQ